MDRGINDKEKVVLGQKDQSKVVNATATTRMPRIQVKIAARKLLKIHPLVWGMAW